MEPKPNLIRAFAAGLETTDANKEDLKQVLLACADRIEELEIETTHVRVPRPL